MMSTSLGTGSVITLIGQLFKTLFQGLAFILVAKSLGAHDFGILISLLALSSLISPFVDFGAYHLIVKRISQGENLTVVTGQALGILTTATPFFIILLCFLSSLLYDHSLILIILVLHH